MPLRSSSFHIASSSRFLRRWLSSVPPGATSPPSRAQVVPFSLLLEDAHVALDKVNCPSQLQLLQSHCRSNRFPSFNCTTQALQFFRRGPMSDGGLLKLVKQPQSPRAACVDLQGFVPQIMPRASIRQCYVPVYLVSAGESRCSIAMVYLTPTCRAKCALLGGCCI
jgi:hypothetical protein